MKTRVKIERITQETREAFTLVLENTPSIAQYLPGQFLNFFLRINGQEVVRQYSFSSSSFIGEPPSVTIKKVAGGLASNFIGEQLRAGDEVSVSPPNGRFTTTFGVARRVLMVAGGSGRNPASGAAAGVLAGAGAAASPSADVGARDFSGMLRDYLPSLDVTGKVDAQVHGNVEGKVHVDVDVKVDGGRVVDTRSSGGALHGELKTGKAMPDTPGP